MNAMKKKQKCYYILLGILFYLPMLGQQTNIKGVVKDAQTGMPLPGVSVLIKSTTKSTTTDLDGNYAINADSKETLQFSYIGYKTIESSVNGKKVINISLKEESNQLEEIVVVGYGTAKRKDLTGSVASVKGKDLAAYPVANVASAMQGRVAGVTVTALDGRPDSKVSIRVRGGGSITQSNDPLFIVDGFPVSNINDIPASLIASIDVLKDASSTAIYGARGANGVVIVTTKAPSGGKISITYNGSTQIKNPSKYLGALNPYDFVKTNWDYASLFALEDAWARAYGLGTTYSNLNPAGINAYKNITDRNIEKEVIRSTTQQNHNINITGGNEKTRYSLSYDILDDNGLKIQSYYKRSNVLAKIKSEIAKNLDLETDLYYSNQEVFGSEQQTNGIGSWITRSLRYTPVEPLGDISGDNTQLGMYDNYVRPDFDPIKTINDIYDKTERQRYRANISLNWKVNDALTLRTDYGMTKNYSTQYQYTGSFAKNTVGVQGGDATISKNYETGYRLVNTANYKFLKLNDKHSLNILVGQEINSKDAENTMISGTNYPIAFDYNRVFALMSQYGDQNAVKISNTYDVPGHLASFFGRVNYTFNDKYLFTATLRADGSSNFAPKNRWGYFPAAAFAWKASDEKFLKDSKIISNLKFRLSYGQVGNDQISPGLWKPEFTGVGGGYGYNNVANAIYVPASDLLINPELKWETTITRNFGIDYGIFNDRIYGTIDAYWNTTKDLLLPKNLPTITGYKNQMANVGQTRNIGIEFGIGGDIVKSNDFKLSANMNVSINRNKIESLAEGIEYSNYSSGWVASLSPSAGDYSLKVGDPVGLIRGYKYDGFYTTADFDYNPTTKAYTLKNGIANSSSVLGVTPGITGAYPGMLKLQKVGNTLSPTNINESDDATIIGNTNAKFTGGLNINASYKSIDLLLGFNGSFGNDIYNANKLANSTGFKLPFRNFDKSVQNRYTLFDVNSTGDLVRIYDPAALDALNSNASTYMPFHENGVIHSGAIEDGSYLRLNNVTAGYTLPSNITKKIAIENLRFFATITNAWLWTKYSGYDPEVDSGNGRNNTYPTPGMDFGSYPKARTFTLGVNAKF